MKKLCILIADDHGLVRRGIREVLHSRDGWRVTGEAATGLEAVAKAKELKPDVAVVDIHMPELDGIEATRQIRESVSETKILVVTINESDSMISRALVPNGRGWRGPRFPRAVLEWKWGRRFDHCGVHYHARAASGGSAAGSEDAESAPFSALRALG